MTLLRIEAKRGTNGVTGTKTLMNGVSVAASTTVTSADDIDVDAASDVLVTMVNGNSTQMEFRIYTAATMDGTYDTVPYMAYQLAAGERMTRPLVPGFAKMKVSAVNLDATNASVVTVSVKPTWR